MLQRRQKSLVLSLSLFLLWAARSQAEGWEQWIRTYDGPAQGMDVTTDLVVDDQDFVYLIGWSAGLGTSWDYVTQKYNPSGTPLWTRRYQQPLYDKALALAVDTQGNVYVTGYSYTPATLEDYATLKYNSSGNLLWAAHYNGPGNGNDEGLAIAVDGEGNVYVTGRSEGLGTYQDCATLKYDSSGNQIWVARYDSPASLTDEALAMVLAPSGSLNICGRSSANPGNYDFLALKYNNQGQEQWGARYNGPGNGLDQAYALVLDSDENLYVVGESAGSTTGSDFTIIKYAPTGTQLWVARFDRFGLHDTAKAVAIAQNGYLYVTGSSDTVSGSGTNSDIMTICLSPVGFLQWCEFYDNPSQGEDRANDIVVDDLGEAFVTGYSDNIGSYQDFVIIKYNPQGIVQWVSNYTGYGFNSDQGNCLALDDEANVYTTGIVSGLSTDLDFALLKYAETPPPTLSIVLDPYNNPSIIPAAGGTLRMNIAVYNYSPSPQTFQVWTEVYAPNGFWFGPLIGPVTLNLPSGSSVNRERLQIVPGNAPGGNYTYVSRLGSFPDSIWAEDRFGFYKIPNADYDPSWATNVWKDVAAADMAPMQIASSQKNDNPIEVSVFPNPFNSTTTIKFTQPQSGWVRLQLFDVSGRTLPLQTNGANQIYTQTLMSRPSTEPAALLWLETGERQIHLDGAGLPAGLYFYSLRTPLGTNGYNLAGKIVVVE